MKEKENKFDNMSNLGNGTKTVHRGEFRNVNDYILKNPKQITYLSALKTRKKKEKKKI